MVMLQLIGTLFIDIDNIYCFGAGLLISMSEDVYHIFAVFNAILIKTAIVLF